MFNLNHASQATGTVNSQLVDDDSFLIDPADWDRSFSEQRAAHRGLELNHHHWRLIDIVRDKYLRLGALPPMRSVCKAAGLDKQQMKAQFGSCLALWKMAGLPNPGEEARAYMN